MREGTAPVVQRADYAPPAYWIRAVDLSFDLDPAKTIVASKLDFERNRDVTEAQPLRLHGEELDLLRVTSGGESISFRQEDGMLVIDNPPPGDRFTLEIRNTCSPQKNTALSGLFPSGGGLFTQCEAEGFRRITYFLDRPDVMAVYKVTLRADKARFPVLLSNGNLVEQGTLDNGRHYAKWSDPFPKPSYLFALVAADLVAREQHIRTRAGKDHLLQIWVKRGDLEKTEHAMNSLVASVVWDEARFGLPLDLERFMIVAVDDFNGGAMENKGLNIFNSKFVLASPATATDDDFAGIESVVAHEYFHNWTGNRITCRDWFQLSLKEGLTVFRDQEFSMDMAATPSARAVKRIEDVRRLRTTQFPEDAGPMAHPVRPEHYAEINNFYTATVYEKGAEVVRMMHALVGREGFARGMALYFQRHDGQAVTCDDFAKAIADANPQSELAQELEAFGHWYSQAGTPRLHARGVHDAERSMYTLELSQSSLPSPGQSSKQPFVIPVLLGLLDAEGRALPLQIEGEDSAQGTQRLLVLTRARQRFTFVGIERPPLPSLLRGFSAPVALDDGLDDSALLHLLHHDDDAFNRWEAAQRLLLNGVRLGLRITGTKPLDPPLVDALRGVLNESGLDPAFKELVLTVPSLRVLMEHFDAADPQQLHALREAMVDQLAAELHEDWKAAWASNQVREGYRPTPAQSGRRALANLALAMLVRHAGRTGDDVWPGRAYQRFKDAGNMTERLGAIQALVHSHAALAEPALARMYELFKTDALVLDKWFILQASAPERDGRVFERVRKLLAHPDFKLANPNRVRALLFTWHTNPGAFHRTDAAGYVLWADKVLELDALNPQVAARMARALDRWRQLAEPYRGAARHAIERVAAKADLSDDTREIITTLLQD